MKNWIPALLFSLLPGTAPAQDIHPAQLRRLQKAEDSLKVLVKNLIVDSLPASRMRQDSIFIRSLVRTLQIPNSFQYPFDSVQGIAKLYSPDSAFRIFSWSLAFDDYYARQRAAIQLRTADGSLKLIPLYDYSEFTEAPQDSVRNRNNWIGAVYYNMVMKEHGGKKYYTLFGFDPNSVRSNKKWIEVLTFGENGQPQFGSAMFSFENDTVKRQPLHRYSIEYKKEASTLVNYDPEMDMILVDHLVSESDEPDKPYTFIPDGDYEGFKWQGGRWVHIDKVFDFKLRDGEAPLPDPIRDEAGNAREDKLEQRSQKNRQTGKKGGN